MFYCEAFCFISKMMCLCHGKRKHTETKENDFFLITRNFVVNIFSIGNEDFFCVFFFGSSMYMGSEIIRF